MNIVWQEPHYVYIFSLHADYVVIQLCTSGNELTYDNYQRISFLLTLPNMIKTYQKNIAWLFRQ